MLSLSVFEHTIIALFSKPTTHRGLANLEVHGGRYRTLHLVFNSKNSTVETQISKSEYYKLYEYFGLTNNLPVEITYLPKSYNNVVLSVTPKAR